jgi:hypothetical protein
VYEGLPYLCMAGDFSGKYGGLAYQNQTDGSASVVAQIKDPRMPSLQNLAGRGLLLKCGTESWCATLQRMLGGGGGGEGAFVAGRVFGGAEETRSALGQSMGARDAPGCGG